MNTIDPPVSIRKYRMADLAAYPEYEATAAQLIAMLQERPNLTNYTSVNGNKAAAPLPFLPVMRHTQNLRAAAVYIETEAVTGIRYLTTYFSPADFLEAEEIVCTFQGISTDGQYYLAVTVLLHSSLFPAKHLCTDKELKQGSACWQKIIETLNAASTDDFHPSLNTIDSLVQSFKFKQ
jgi:hypothetical protein